MVGDGSIKICYTVVSLPLWKQRYKNQTMTKRIAKAVEIYSLKSNERYGQRESKGSPSLS